MTSLNPEATPFVPNEPVEFDAEGSNRKVSNCVKTANAFPKNMAYEMYKKISEFSEVAGILYDMVINNQNKVLEVEGIQFKLKKDSLNLNVERIIEANDIILDRSNELLDLVSKGPKPESSKPETNISHWNLQPVITKPKLGDTTLFAAKNIIRPQINFKDQIDNSENLWVPIIKYKPNSIKPLAIMPVFDDNGATVGFKHPYHWELDAFHVSDKLLQLREPYNPPPVEETPLTIIESVSQLLDFVRHLKTVKEIGVDVEHHSYRTYQGITCLVQVTTTEGGDFIIDVLKLRAHMHHLNESFTDPKILKIFHGAQNDIIWLQRDFGVYVVNMFDTYQAALSLNLPVSTFKYLLQKYCHIETDKKYQLADWRIRPLPNELLHYARLDTHYLIYIWQLMKNDLLKAAGGTTTLLTSVFEKSRQTCCQTYTKRVIDENSHLKLYANAKDASHLNTRQMAVLKALYLWRDQMAREQDESTGYVLPNAMLKKLAEVMPREIQGIYACCDFLPPLIKQNLHNIHMIILQCRNLPLEPQLYQMPSSINTIVNHQTNFTVKLHDFYPEDMGINQSALLNKPTKITNDQDLNGDFNSKYFQSGFNDNSKESIIRSIEVKYFTPPYKRYQKFRLLEKERELKDYEEKKQKLDAINKLNMIGIQTSENGESKTIKEIVKRKQDDNNSTGFDKVVENQGKVLESKEKIVENKGKVVENKGKVVENKGKVVENKGKVVENKEKVVAKQSLNHNKLKSTDHIKSLGKDKYSNENYERFKTKTYIENKGKQKK